MAITNKERVGRSLDLLVEGLRPFIEREVRATNGQEPLDRRLPGSQSQDVAELLRLMVQEWNSVFRRTLGRTERSYVPELQDIRNAWAHSESFSYADTYRAADTAGRLLRSVSAKEAEEIEAIATEVQRVQFDDQVRSRTRTRSRVARSQVEEAETAQVIEDRNPGRFNSDHQPPATELANSESSSVQSND